MANICCYKFVNILTYLAAKVFTCSLRSPSASCSKVIFSVDDLTEVQETRTIISGPSI